jgi:hypothetical protein
MTLPRFIMIQGTRFLLTRRGDSKYVHMLNTSTGKPQWVTRDRAKAKPDKYKPLDSGHGAVPPGEEKPAPAAMPPGESKYIRVMHKAKGRPVWVTRERYQKKPHKYEPLPVTETVPVNAPHRPEFDAATAAASAKAKAKFKGRRYEKPEDNPHFPKVQRQFAPMRKLLEQHGRGLKFGLGPRVVHWEPNPDYDPKTDDQFVGRAINEDGSVERKYTLSYTKRNNLGKFVHFPEIAKSVGPFLKRVKQDLQSPDQRTRMLAFGAALTEDALIRSGTPKKGDDTGAIGLTQLRKRNIKFGTSRKTGTPYFQIEYVGKSGVEHFGPDAPKITNPRLVKMMRGIVADKQNKDKLFTTEAGRVLTPSHLNRYMKERGFAGTVKTFRYYKGTSMAQQLFEAKPPSSEVKANPKAFDAWYEHHIVYPVSKKLGHAVKDRDETTGKLKKKLRGSKTTRVHYIDLNMQAAHYKQHGFALPDKVADHMREFVEKKRKGKKKPTKPISVSKARRAAEFVGASLDDYDPEAQHLIEVFHTLDPDAAALPQLPPLEPADFEEDEEDESPAVS